MPYLEKDHPMIGDNYKIRKALVTLAIEKSLLAIGKPVYNQVASALKKEYDCYLPDCYEHPEYLKKILQDLFGKSSDTMIESIKNQLEEFAEQNGIKTFIEVICG